MQLIAGKCTLVFDCRIWFLLHDIIASHRRDLRPTSLSSLFSSTLYPGLLESLSEILRLLALP